jgi:hypothetical protein
MRQVCMKRLCISAIRLHGNERCLPVLVYYRHEIEQARRYDDARHYAEYERLEHYPPRSVVGLLPGQQLSSGV